MHGTGVKITAQELDTKIYKSYSRPPTYIGLFSAIFWEALEIKTQHWLIKL